MIRRDKSPTARLSPVLQNAVGEVPALSGAGDKPIKALRNKHFVFVNEYINEYELKLGEGQGVQREWLVDHPDPLGPELLYLQKYKLGRGINITHDYWGCFTERSLDEIIAYADYISTDSRVLTPEHFELFLRKMQEDPGKLYHRALIECDTRTNWDAHPGCFRSHQEAMAWWKNYVLNAQRQWVDPATHQPLALRDVRCELLAGGNMAEYIRRGMPNRTFQFVASAGEVWSVHQYFDWGFDAVTLERNLQCGNVNVGVAFLRGAARQYDNRKWGLDLTCWLDMAPPEATPAVFDEKQRQIDGPSPDLYFREWVAARMNGADFVHQIFSELTFFNLPFRPQEQRVLSPIGKRAVEFQALLDGPLQDVGRAIVPLAILMDRHHGWCESRWDRDGPFGNKLPQRPEDRSIARVFDYLFPSYHLATRSGMKFYQPELPWFGYCQRREALARGADRRLQEKGILADTRFGDIADVVVDNASAEALAAYPMVMILGGLVLEDRHLEALEAYVRQGGILLLNTRHYPPQQTALGGYTVEAEYRFYEGQTSCQLCGRKVNDYLYEYSAVKPFEGTRALMHNEENYAGFPPLAVERALGKGRIITSLVYNYTILRGEQLACSVEHLLDHLIAPLLPWRIEGGPIQAIFCESESNPDRQYVTLLNQHERRWSGVVRCAKWKVVSVADAFTGAPQTPGLTALPVTVEPFGVRVLRIDLGREHDASFPTISFARPIAPLHR